MPLSAPAPRDEMHARRIDIRGYRRADGLCDVEARLTDTKPYGFDNKFRGRIEAGEPLHEMRARMTIDERFTIVAFEAETLAGPYAICPRAAENFGRLAGIRLGPGFMREVQARVGGAAGCTHLRELLPQMATTAMQTLFTVFAARDRRLDRAPAMLNSCMAYAADGEVARELWPEFAATGEAEAVP